MTDRIPLKLQDLGDGEGRLREFETGDTVPYAHLPVGTTAGTVAAGDDTRLSNAREWSAETVTQAEAETGTATTRRAWTSQRVRQAIAAWWDSVASASGKTVATGTPAQGRTALGLGTAATANVTTSDTDMTPGRLLKRGDFGIGAGTLPTRNSAELNGMGLVASRLDPGDPANPIPFGATNIHCSASASFGGGLVMDVAASPSISHYSVRQGVVYGPRRLLDSGNTTIDSNGFIKNASPIIKLHSDRIESSSEDGPAFERLDTGHYQLTGTNGLRLDDGWYIETPHDKNGNKYFNVEWEQDLEPETEAGVLEEPEDVTLTIRCYERVWNPQTGQFDNGDPVDIPDGRWIDLRLNEVRQPEPEMSEAPDEPELPPESAEPVIPSVVTMAQAKLALLYAGLYEQVEQALADLPEPQKTAALIEWNHRQTLEREHPLVGQVAEGLGLTEQQLDELFLDASTR